MGILSKFFFASLSLCEALKKEKALVSRGSNSHQINYQKGARVKKRGVPTTHQNTEGGSLACSLAWGADKKIMIGKKSTLVMEINMQNRVIALQQTAWPPETMTNLSWQSWPILGKMLVLQICLQPRGCFPTGVFITRKEQNKQTNQPVPLPSSLPPVFQEYYSSCNP